MEDQSPELDAQRILRLAKARQAAMRSASDCLIVAGGCGVASIDLLWRALRRFWALAEWFRPLLYLLGACVLTWLCVHFTAKAFHIRREARQKALPDPTVPPDFSTLSDGSQFAKNLERIE